MGPTVIPDNSRFAMASPEPPPVVDVQFITVFLGSFVAGSFLNQAKELLNNPTSIVSTLGTSAPLTSVFFLTFIELNVCLLALHPPSQNLCLLKVTLLYLKYFEERADDLHLTIGAP